MGDVSIDRPDVSSEWAAKIKSLAEAIYSPAAHGNMDALINTITSHLSPLFTPKVDKSIGTETNQAFVEKNKERREAEFYLRMAQAVRNETKWFHDLEFRLKQPHSCDTASPNAICERMKAAEHNLETAKHQVGTSCTLP